MAFWKPAPAPAAAPLVNSRTFTFSPPIIAGIAASSISYLIMNMLMVQATLVMESICTSFNASTFAIQGHVIAMFAPSLVAGAILVRAGYRNTLLAGYLLIGTTALLGILGSGFEAIVIALLTLGVGWNLGYVGGGALLAHSLTEENRHRVQGINDSIIAICATIGAFLPAILQASIGWQNTNLLCLGLCAAGAVLTRTCLRDTKSAVQEARQS
jgi:MFS family permease